MPLPSWIENRLPADEAKRERSKLAIASVLVVTAVSIAWLGVRSPRPAEIPAVFGAMAVGDAAAVRNALADDKRVVLDTDVEGNTPLHIAAASGWAELIQCLLDAGADPNAKNKAGWTPLFAATEAPRAGQGAVVCLLPSHGASTDVVLPDGQTVLHVAANTPTTDPRVVPLLARDKTPLQLAQASNFKATEQVLRRL